MQQRHERGEQHHVGAGIGAARQVVHGLGQRGVDAEIDRVATCRQAGFVSVVAKDLHSVGRQVDDTWRAGQLAVPVVEVWARGFVLVEVRALPLREVGVLNGQVGKRLKRRPRGLPRDLAAVAEVGVESGEFTNQDAGGPPVGCGVMQRDGEHVFVGVAGDEQCPNGVFRGEVEDVLRLGSEHRAQGVVALGWRGIDQRQRPVQARARVGVDQLHRLALLVDQASSEHLVAANNRLQRGRHRRRVEVPAQAKRGGHVVGSRAAIETLEEPDAALGKRQRKGLAAVGDRNGRRPTGRRLLPDPLEEASPLLGAESGQAVTQATSPRSAAAAATRRPWPWPQP